MNNLFIKLQIIQFLILMSLMIISNKMSYKKEMLDEKSDYYQFLLDINEYDKIIKAFLKNYNSDEKNINDAFLSKNEYFYYFHNKNNILTYFFKEKTNDQHIIYFNGFFDKNDLKTIMNIIFYKFTFSYIKNLLDKTGDFYKVDNNNNIEKYIENISILDIFDQIYNELYNLNDPDKKIKFKIIGYSMGGPISQVFINLLLEKYNDKLEIEIVNIESWFNGNKESYDKFNNNFTFTNITNIFNKNSLLYLNNIIFQKYVNTDYLLKNNNEKNYNNKLFPFGIVNYIINNHYILDD